MTTQDKDPGDATLKELAAYWRMPSERAARELHAAWPSPSAWKISMVCDLRLEGLAPPLRALAELKLSLSTEIMRWSLCLSLIPCGRSECAGNHDSVSAGSASAPPPLVLALPAVRAPAGRLGSRFDLDDRLGPRAPPPVMGREFILDLRRRQIIQMLG